MKDYIDLEEVKSTYIVDIGGTPANVLERGKLCFLLNRGIKPKQIISIMDPFDLSRTERSLVFNNYGNVKKLKFSIPENITNEKTSSELVPAPDSKQILSFFTENKGKILDPLYIKYKIFSKEEKNKISQRYDDVKNNISTLSINSQNLREFMNSLIEVLSPVKIIVKKLETILSENQNKIFEALKFKDIESRSFCPTCKKMISCTFNKDKLKEIFCCSNTVENIIKSGNYIPEEGMLPTLLYLSGITPCISTNSDYGKKALDILKNLQKFDRPIVMYSGNPDMTMFESYLLWR